MAGNNDLELVVRARNDVSGALSSAKADISRFTAGVTNDIKSLSGVSREAGSSLRGISAGLVAAGGIGILKSTIGGAVSASNELNGALTGLSTTAAAFGQDVSATNQAARDLAADGLMSLTEASNGLKNLLASGYNLPQSIALMNAFKDSAAFGRQAALGFGEAIEGATQGIKNGQSELVDNAGVTKNLSVILTEAGLSAQDLGNAQSDAGVRAAIFNGIMRETASQTGNAAKLSASFAGESARLGVAATSVQARLGGLVSMGLLPVVSGLANFVTANQAAIVSAIAAGAAATAIVVGVTGVVAVAGVAATVLGGPLTIALAAIAALAGVVVYGAFQRLQKQFGSTLGAFIDDSKKSANASAANMGAINKDAQKTAEQLADIDRSIARANRDFVQSLTDDIRQHQQRLSDTTKSMAQEQADFTRSQQQRAADYGRAMAEMARTHGQRVDDLQRDLDDEVAKGRFADDKRLEDLRTRLARENEDYGLSVAEKQRSYEEDTQNAQEQQNRKLADVQAQIDTENAYLNKHAADVAAVNGRMALDTIEKMKQSHADQMQQLDLQRQRVVGNAGATASQSIAAMNAAAGMASTDAFKGLGKKMGDDMARALKDAFTASLIDLGKGFIWNWGIEMGRAFWGGINDFSKKVLPGGSDPISGMMAKLFNALPKFATGVEGFSGGAAIVGERGPELVTLPRGANVYPADRTAQMLSGNGGGVTINQTNHNYTQYDQTAATRELGWMLAVRA